MLYSWQLPFTLIEDDLWSWRLETPADYPTHHSLSQEVPEAGGVGLALAWAKQGPKVTASFPSRCTVAVGHRRCLSLPEPHSLTQGQRHSLCVFFFSLAMIA